MVARRDSLEVYTANLQARLTTAREIVSCESCMISQAPYLPLQTRRVETRSSMLCVILRGEDI